MRLFASLLIISSLLSAAETASVQLLRWMDATAQKQLAARREKIQAIRNPEQAHARQTEVRAKLEKLFGPAPTEKPPLDPHVTGKLEEPDYIIENVYFTSLPGVYITANLYRPRSSGKHPGILYSLGHWEAGKPAGQLIAANLARKGFVVLAYDPTGQGERLQAYDSRTGNSLLGGATEQHFAAGAQALLTGQTLSRYMLHDSQRALDYLASRPEVDADRIGAAGCSGGGTQTTYVSALDPRVKVAAPACYMNSFQVLYSGSVGDPEQTIPNFLAEGLDQSDYVELFAPKPWLISSTEKDFFTPAGAKIVYEEARQWYRMLGHEERVKWVVGPGGHGTPLEVREAIYDWMIRWLMDGRGNAKEESVHLRSDSELLVTPKGQAALLPGARDLSSVIAAAHRSSASGSYSYTTESSLTVDTVSTKEENRVQSSELRLTIGGLPLMATLRVPVGAKNAPGVLLIQQTIPQNALALKLASQGAVVLQFWPRGLPSDFISNTRLSGDWITPLRAALISRNLVGDRVADILTAARVLAERPEVDRTHLRAYGSGTAGIWLLHAAQTGRFEKIWLDRTPVSLERMLESPVIRDAFDGLTPGSRIGLDLPTVRASVAKKSKVLWTDPTDWMRNVLPNLPGGYQYRAFDGSDEPYWDFLIR